MANNTKSTAKTVGLVMIIMLVSRLLALVSASVYVAFFGNSIELNIYSYAISLPNIIFTVLGTAIATVVIPIFAGYMGTGEKERAFKFADNVLSLSISSTAVLSLAAVLAAPFFVFFTDFKDQGHDFAVMALRIMFPVMIFYALNYVLQGVLQSLGRFNMPALVSVPSSLIVILYVYILGAKYGVGGLLVATFTGLAMQGLILIPPVLRTEYRYKPSFAYRDEDVKKALRLIPPVLLGTSAYQLNMLFNITVVANFKDAVTIFTVVQNLVLYSILAFVYSITAVIFPRFTMLAARNDMEGFKQSLLKVLKTIVYFLIPATAGFLAIRYQLLSLIVGWGKMTANDVDLASRIMALYALGVTGVGIKEVVDRAFYSLKDTRTPAINGVIIMAVNIAVSLGLIKAAQIFNIYGVYAVPVAYSVSALTGGIVLIFLMKKKIGAFGGKSLVVTVLKVSAASGVMFAAILPLNTLLAGFNSGMPFIDKCVKLFVPVGAGGLIFYIATYLLKVEEAVEVLDKVKARFGRK